jgi:hypothetical protein
MVKQPKLSLYWKCQLIGWSLASLYWTVTGGLAALHFSWALAFLHYIGDLLIYIPLTHAYRNFARKKGWQLLSPKQLVIRLIPAVLILGTLSAILTVYKLYIVNSFAGSFIPNLLPGAARPAPPLDMLKTAGASYFITGVRLMSIWLLAWHGYHFAQREFRAVKEAARLSNIARDAAFNNLSAQLNPHFFFNSLNSIKALTAEDPQKARRAIDLLSDLLRHSLYNRNTSLISLTDELNTTKDYLDLEKIRFEDRLQFHIQSDPALAKQLIPPLSIQVLVENAIKHGITKTKNGGTIHINVSQHNGHIQASVQNPGRLHNETKEGLGLKNLAERLQLQFNGKASLQILQQSNDTVLATITTPL